MNEDANHNRALPDSGADEGQKRVPCQIKVHWQEMAGGCRKPVRIDVLRVSRLQSEQEPGVLPHLAGQEVHQHSSDAGNHQEP